MIVVRTFSCFYQGERAICNVFKSTWPINLLKHLFRPLDPDMNSHLNTESLQGVQTRTVKLPQRLYLSDINKVFSLFVAMTKCIRDKNKSVCLCCELNYFFMRNLRKKKLTWWTCHEVVNLNPALKSKVSFVCDDTCGTPGLGRGEYSSNIRVKESRWGFETLTQFRTTKTLKIHTLFRTNAKMKAVLF